MKLKRILCFALVAILCLSLCACRIDLDEIRETVGYIQPDGETIIKNGVEFRLFDKHLDIPLNTNYDATVYVCTPDVPLLAADYSTGDEFYPGFDGVFLSNSDAYYCRADRYDEVKRAFENAPEKATTYQYVYEDEMYYDRLAALTKEQAAVISKVIDEGTFTPLMHTYPEQDDYCIDIYACDDTGWVVFDKLTVSWDIDEESDTRTYWISKATENDWLYECLTVPAEYSETFNSTFGFVEEPKGDLEFDW